jgi:hypothetical protein
MQLITEQSVGWGVGPGYSPYHVAMLPMHCIAVHEPDVMCIIVSSQLVALLLP